MYRWPYEQMNFFRWQSIVYVNGMGLHTSTSLLNLSRFCH